MLSDKTLYYYTCSECNVDVPATEIDLDPVIMIPGVKKNEWIFLCRKCEDNNTTKESK